MPGGPPRPARRRRATRAPCWCLPPSRLIPAHCGRSVCRDGAVAPTESAVVDSPRAPRWGRPGPARRGRRSRRDHHPQPARGAQRAEPRARRTRCGTRSAPPATIPTSTRWSSPGPIPRSAPGVDLKEVSGEIPPTDGPRGPGEGPERYAQRALPVHPGDPEAGDRRDQRRRGHGRARARAAVHVPRRVGAGAFRRHARARRDHAGWRHHRAAGAVDRPAARDRDVAHRQLRRPPTKRCGSAW